MRIIRAEWRRFFARRFTRIMLIVVVLIMSAIAIGLAVNSQRPTPAVRAQAQQQVAAYLAQEQTDHDACIAVQNGAPDLDGRYQLPPGITCDQAFAVFPLNATDFMPTEWSFADQARNVILLFCGLLALFGFAVGASYVGAEWSSGGMMNLLLWRPQRLAVLGAKLITLVTAVVASAIGLLAVWLGMLSVVAAARGEFGHASAGTMQSWGLLAARALVVGLVAAIAGFGLASVGRNTVTALAVAIGYIVLFEAAGHLIFGRLLGLMRPEKFFLSSYVAAWLFKGQTFYVNTCPPAGGECTSKPWTISMGHGATVVGVIVAVIVVWAFIAFRRRDVT